jgi:hypothetical protein
MLVVGVNKLLSLPCSHCYNEEEERTPGNYPETTHSITTKTTTCRLHKLPSSDHWLLSTQPAFTSPSFRKKSTNYIPMWYGFRFIVTAVLEVRLDRIFNYGFAKKKGSSTTSLTSALSKSQLEPGPNRAFRIADCRPWVGASTSVPMDVFES